MAGLLGLNAAIEGSVQLNNTAIQGYQQRKNLERQNRYNREMAEYQYNKDLEMWNRANLYNSPQAQMERLKAAGLNPNLVYGHGAVAGQSAGQIPKYQAPQASFNVDPMVKLPTNMLGMFQDFQLKQLQIDNLTKQNQGTDLDNTMKAIEAKVKQTYAMLTAGDKLSILGNQNRKTWYDSLISQYQADMTEQKRGQYLIELTQARQKEQQEIESAQLDNIFKAFRNDWAAMGITSSDNVVFRMMARMLMETGLFKSYSSVMK